MKNLHSLFLSRTGKSVEPTTLTGKVVRSLQNSLDNAGGRFVEQGAASAFVSLESFTPSMESELQDAGEKLASTISEVVSVESMGNIAQAAEMGSNQQVAAMYAAVLAQAGSQAIHMKTTTPSLESNQRWIDYSGQGDYLGTRIKAALESYDERDNKHATAYSIAYNLLAARQDEFGEAFFPTVVVPPDQVGFVLSIRLINVMDDIRRDVSGALNDFNKHNIIHAVLDATILDNDSTKIVPVYQGSSSANFVAGLTPQNVIVEGETVSTSALAFGKRFSLLGIAQPDKLLQNGTADVTDAIDSAIKLDSVVIKLDDGVDGEFVKIRTAYTPLAEFNSAQQGHYRTMRLNFDPQALILNGAIALADGTGNSTVLAGMVTTKHTVHLSVSINGSINQELGDCSLNAGALEVLAVYDEDGNKLDMTTGAGKTTHDLFNGATYAGYTLDARRTDSNRRQRGQLLTTDYYQQIYNVPLHGPITTLRPVTISDQTDAADLAALVTATHIRASNAAVTKLIDFASVLRGYKQDSQQVQQNPEFLGVGNYLVKAWYHEEEIAVADVVDSIKSSDRMADLQAAIVSVIRHAAYTAYRDTGYKAASDALAGGVGPKPTVIIGSDPVICNYLLVNGDFRTLGNDFDVKIVMTLDTRVTNKIYMTFGQFGEGKEGQPNPMHFGNMGWKPEQTIVLPMTRNGQISKELTVQPAFVHVVNLPILAEFSVTGIEDVIEQKVTVNMDQQS